MNLQVERVRLAESVKELADRLLQELPEDTPDEVWIALQDILAGDVLGEDATALQVLGNYDPEDEELGGFVEELYEEARTYARLIEGAEEFRGAVWKRPGERHEVYLGRVGCGSYSTDFTALYEPEECEVSVRVEGQGPDNGDVVLSVGGSRDDVGDVVRDYVDSCITVMRVDFTA